jgi:hypothetical protein
MNLYDFITNMPEENVCTFTFPNNGVIFSRLHKDLYNQLMDAINEAKKNKIMNHKLVGHLQEEFEFPQGKRLLQNFIISLAWSHANTYNHLYNSAVNTKFKPMKLDTVWVNFQKKHEFNPPHGHDGLYSFVIWMKVPYDLKQEKDVFDKVRHQMASMFGFITNDILGRSHVNPIPVDKNYEGVVCLFPSSLLHYVNPFYTSDEERISISGNVFFDVDYSDGPASLR